jgi:futalosine hydrolase
LRGWLPVYAAPVEGEALAALGAVRLGVGTVAAALARHDLLLRERPAGVLLLGVAGAYPARHRDGATLAVGDVALVDRDGFADEGVRTEDGFRDLRALGLGDVGPFAADAAATARAAALLGVPVVRGATVSTCSGSEALSQELAARTGAALETMEGAAVASVCARHGVPGVLGRAVPNYTGPRARGAWHLAAAVSAVQAAVRRLHG